MSQNPPKKPKKPEKYLTEEIKVEKFIPGGQALATLANGKKIFLWNALPGEVVTKVRVTREKSSYLEGIAELISQSSPHRITPKDSCYLATSPWQILDPDYEQSVKVDLIREVLRQHGITIPETLSELEVKGSVDYFYRNKMEYALFYDHADQQIHLAFHTRGSHRKIPVTQSSLERPEIWQRATTIVDKLNAKHADARDYQTLLLRCSQDGTVSGGLYRNHQPHPQFAALHDELLGMTYSYSPNGFFQINLPVYAAALAEISAVLSQYPHLDNVLDLYAGVGTIGLSVARERRLTLVECDRSAYDEMVANVAAVSRAANNPYIKPILAPSETALTSVAPDQVVIVDPPRAGCRPELIERFLEVQPEVIIYLSCNPATQARDLKLLLPAYEIMKIQPFNFFPRTPHIENLVVLKRRKNSSEAIHGS